MRLLSPTVFILAPAAIGAAGAGVAYAQTLPRATVLILAQPARAGEARPGGAGETQSRGAAEPPDSEAFARALRARRDVRPLLRAGSGVFLAADGRVPENAVAIGRAGLERGREYLRLLRFPEAESSLHEAVRALEQVGAPDAYALRREAQILHAIVLLESGRRDAALRGFIAVLTHDPALELDAVRFSPFVREAFEQARQTLALLPKGALRVETSPPALDVWIDGRLAGRTPLVQRDLVSGAHVVATLAVSPGAGAPAQAKSYWSRMIAVPPGETGRVTVLLDGPRDVSDIDSALRIARGMDADRVVILSPGPQGRVRGQVVDVTSGRPGVARESNDEVSLAAALTRELGFRVAERPLEERRPAAPKEKAWYENWWVYLPIGVGLVVGTIGVAAILDRENPDELPAR